MSVQSEVGQVDLTAEPSVGDFIQLMKPRVMTLVILTALAAMLAAPGSLNPVIGIDRDDLDCHRCGRLGRPQYVVRR